MKVKKTISRVLTALLIAVIAVLGLFSAQRLTEYELQRQDNLSVVNEARKQFYEEDNDDHETVSTDMPQEDLLTRYNAMKEKNPDYACWLKIDDTSIDHPVMQASESNPSYYLHHNINRKWDSYGSFLISSSCTVESDNVVIYGHHMRDGTMFSVLDRYRKSKWANDHRMIELITDKEHRYYEVVAVLIQDASHPDIVWEDHIDFDTLGKSYYYGIECIRRSKVDFGYEPTGDEMYLTLVTCEYSHENGRLLVVARRVQ